MTGPLPVARRAGAGVELAVKVTPRAGHAAITGTVIDAAGTAWLSVKVTAPPDRGRANEAVLALLARHLNVFGSACGVVAGTTGRWKRIRIEGDPDQLQ